MLRFTVLAFCSRKLRIWMDSPLVIVCILEVKGLGLFGLVFAQPLVFHEVDECLVSE